MQEPICYFFWWTLSSVQLLQSNAATTQQLLDVLMAFGDGDVCIGTMPTTSKALLSACICCMQYFVRSLITHPPTH